MHLCEMYLFHEQSDCMGTQNGKAFYDVCRVCSEGSSGNTANLLVSNCSPVTGINPTSQNERILKLVNPIREEGLQIKTTTQINFLTLYDVQGHISEQSNDLNQPLGTQLSPGIYFLQVSYIDGVQEVYKLIKE